MLMEKRLTSLGIKNDLLIKKNATPKTTYTGHYCDSGSWY